LAPKNKDLYKDFAKVLKNFGDEEIITKSRSALDV